MRESLVLVAAAVVLCLIAPQVSGDQTVNYYVSRESVIKGTSNGFQNEVEGDGSVNTKIETNNGTATVLLLPLGDSSIDWDYVGGTSLTNHTQALTQTGEPDSNTSYITGKTFDLDQHDGDIYDLDDASLPTGTVITNVKAFAWARKNQSLDAGLLFNLTDSSGECSGSAFKLLIGAFANYSNTWTQSCNGDDWTSADIDAMRLTLWTESGEATPRYTTVTYAGIIVTYQLPYWLDMTSTINIPSEMVEQTTIRLSCSLSGDAEGFTLQIAGATVATGLCIAPYIDTSYDTSARGDVAIRWYSNPDPTPTTYAIDLLIAQVVIKSGGGGLKAPNPICTYNQFTMNFDCVDMQDYGDMRISWIRWKIDDREPVKGDPKGHVALPSGEGFWESGSLSHVVYATAVYESGSEMLTSITVHSYNGIRLIFPVIIICFVVIIIALLYEKRRRKE